MAALAERIESARRAMAAFEELLDGGTPDAIRRDAVTLRFVFAFEAVLSAARQFLKDIELEQRSTTGACIRASQAAGLVSEEDAEVLLAVAQDRNRAVHVYSEAMAQALLERLPAHAAVLRGWLEAMAARAP